MQTMDELKPIYVAWKMGARIEFKFINDSDKGWIDCIGIERYGRRGQDETDSLVYACAHEPRFAANRQVMLRIKPKD